MRVVIAHDVLMNTHSVSLGQIGLKLTQSCLRDCITIRQKLTAVAD